MKKLIGVACSVGLTVFAFTGGTAKAEYIEDFELGIETGYRTDDLDWNIAGSLAGINPNILSELSWQDLEIYQLGASGRLAVGNKDVDFFTYLRGSFNYGWIKDGSGLDSDFLGDNRTEEFSRSSFTTEDDNVLDASIGLGLQWKFWQKRLAIAPLGGYSYHEQNLRNTNGVQLVSRQDLLPGLPSVGPFPSTLDSTYETQWKGPWAGIDIELKPVPRFSLLGTFEYHWADYEAEANWNLNENFAHPLSFRHEADEADGLIAKVTGRYLFASGLAIDLSYTYQDWQAESGTDTTFPAAGGTFPVKLNEVNWKSSAVTAGLSFKFY